MFDVGQRLSGWKYNESGVLVQIFGTFIAMTEDDEERYQDVIMNVDGKIECFDERDVVEVKWCDNSEIMK